MVLYFDENGVLKDSRTYGRAARAGSTDFKIFAYFENINLAIYNTASIKLRKPDMDQTEYPSLIMDVKSLVYDENIGGESAYFMDGQSYTGYMLDFSKLSAFGGDVVVLLDTPGLWEAIINLYSMNHIISVQGVSTFNVENGMYSQIGTEIEATDVLPAVYAEIATRLKYSDAILVLENAPTDAELEFFDDGQMFFIKSTGTFMKNEDEELVVVTPGGCATEEWVQEQGYFSEEDFASNTDIDNLF